jgi:hypothetical protein
MSGRTRAEPPLWRWSPPPGTAVYVAPNRTIWSVAATCAAWTSLAALVASADVVFDVSAVERGVVT